MSTPPITLPGQTATLLGDGRWLLLGGLHAGQAIATGGLLDPGTGTAAPVGDLAVARSGHSATTLPDGSVLILGGIGRDGRVVATVERFVPDTGQFQPISVPGLTPRTAHTATLLTDGRLLVAGGQDDARQPVAEAQLWDSRSGAIHALGGTPRVGHTATLQPDGTVRLSGGTDAAGIALSSSEVFDPGQSRLASVPSEASPAPTTDPPQIRASVPSPDDVDVPTDGLIALRASQPLRVGTITDTSVVLSAPSGPVPARIVAAEGGLLVFVTPTAPLAPGTRYTVAVNGAENRDGLPVPFTAVPFTTAPAAASTTLTARGPQGITVAADAAVKGGGAEGDDSVWRGERRN